MQSSLYLPHRRFREIGQDFENSELDYKNCEVFSSTILTPFLLLIGSAIICVILFRQQDKGSSNVASSSLKISGTGTRPLI